MIYRSASNRANWATFFLVVYGVIGIISIASTIAEIGLLQRVESGGSLTTAEAARNDNRQAIISILQLLALGVVIIAFLMWIHRASKNLAPLGWLDQQFSPGWAVGWWFVPIWWLFRPYQVMKEIWTGSGDSRLSPLLGPWWAAWLLTSWLDAFATMLSLPDDTTASDLIVADLVFVAAAGIGMVALALVVILMRQITSNQANRANMQAMEGPPSTAYPATPPT